MLFREDVLGEDIDWVLQLFSHVRTICLMNLRTYAYTQRKTVSRSTQSDAPNDLVAIFYRIFGYRLTCGAAVSAAADLLMRTENE